GKTCMLRWFWLGLQDSGKRWQVYKNCVPLAGTGGSATAGDADTKTPATTTTAPKATTKTPAATTKAPTAAPKATTKAPAPTKAEVGGDATEKPAVVVAKNSTMDAGVKCKVKAT
ncbi:Cytochrome p450 86a2, partial [Globisporangium polare]